MGSKPDARIERRSLRVPLSVSDSRPERAAYALLPLRAFLGFTFCYAGLQKLANPAFFNARSPISIQAQFLGAVRRSPIHALLQPLSSHAWAIGVLMALGELAVGLGTLAGLFTRIAALGGAVISFSLFLTVSFHSNPWYTGSDIVFFFAWLPLLVAVAGRSLLMPGLTARCNDEHRAARVRMFRLMRCVAGWLARLLFSSVRSVWHWPA